MAPIPADDPARQLTVVSRPGSDSGGKGCRSLPLPPPRSGRGIRCGRDVASTSLRLPAGAPGWPPRPGEVACLAVTNRRSVRRWRRCLPEASAPVVVRPRGEPAWFAGLPCRAGLGLSAFAAMGAQFPARSVAAVPAFLAPQVVPLPVAFALAATDPVGLRAAPITAGPGAAQGRAVGGDLVRQGARAEPMVMHRLAGHHRRVCHLHPPGPSLVGLAHTGTFRLRDAPDWGRHQIGCTVITSDIAHDRQDRKQHAASRI